MTPSSFPPKEEIARLTARMLLEIKAVHFNAETPFTLASGLPSPTYIDCRKLISYPRIRSTLMDFMAVTVMRDAGLTGRVRTPNRNTASTSLISSQTELVVLATSVDALGSLMEMRAWAPLQADPNIRVWTDDYVNIIGALN